MHALVELQRRGGVYEHLVALGSEIELLVSLRLALAVHFGCRALCAFHLRVEGEDERVGVGVDAQHGSPVLRRAGRERHGRVGAAEEGNVNVIVGALGVAGDTNRAGGNVERVGLACLEIAFAELYRDALGGAVGLKRYGGVDFRARLVAQFHGVGRAEDGDVAVEGDGDFLQLGNGHAAHGVGTPSVEQVDALGCGGDAFGQRHDVRLARTGKDTDATAVVGDADGGAGIDVSGIFEEIKIVFLRENLRKAHPIVAFLGRPFAVGIAKGRCAEQLTFVGGAPCADAVVLVSVEEREAVVLHIVDKGCFIFRGVFALREFFHDVRRAAHVAAVVGHAHDGEV